MFLQDCMAFLCGPANSGLLRAAVPEMGFGPGVTCEHGQQIKVPSTLTDEKDMVEKKLNIYSIEEQGYYK